MKGMEILNCVETGPGSEAQAWACRFCEDAMGSDNDLCLQLLYFDYPFPSASIYFNHDGYGPAE